MINPRLTDQQRQRFPAEINWQQLSADARRQMTALLTTLCIEVIDEAQNSVKEERHEPTKY
jgi:hypothetical protein